MWPRHLDLGSYPSLHEDLAELLRVMPRLDLCIALLSHSAFATEGFNVEQVLVVSSVQVHLLDSNLL